MDKVRVNSNGGVSALSAFFTGVGSAVALDLPLEMTVAYAEEWYKPATGVVADTLDALRDRFAIKEHFRVSVSKAIPRGKGLKSSSALTLSIVLGFLRLNGINIPETEMLNLAAELSILNGTSSTGAYDDLCSSYYGGICLTDNRKREVLFRGSVEQKPVIIAFNMGRRSSSSVDLQEMEKYSKHAEEIESLIRGKKYYEAMTLNGNLMGYVYGQNSDIIKYFLHSGARFSAQCGKGPAIFAIFDTEGEMAEAAKGLGNFLSVNSRLTSFSNTGSSVTEL